MPLVVSQGVDPLAHLPDRPWVNRLFRVISMTPFGREAGGRKDPRKQTGKGRGFLCAPEPGWQKGAGRTRLGEWKRCPAASPVSSASFPGPGPGPPQPLTPPAGWERRRRGAREVCSNFSIPGKTRAPGRSSWSREFESRGTPRFESLPAVLRTALQGLLEAGCVWSWAEGRKRCCPLCRDGDYPRSGLGVSLLRSRPERGGLLRALHGRGSPGGGAWGFNSHMEGNETGRWQVPGVNTRVPGKFTEQDSWDNLRIPRGTWGSC